MESLGITEKVLTSALVIMMLVLIWPGVKKSLQESRSVQERDWGGFLKPVLLVAVMVFCLIALARCERKSENVIDMPENSLTTRPKLDI